MHHQLEYIFCFTVLLKLTTQSCRSFSFLETFKIKWNSCVWSAIICYFVHFTVGVVHTQFWQFKHPQFHNHYKMDSRSSDISDWECISNIHVPEIVTKSWSTLHFSYIFFLHFLTLPIIIHSTSSVINHIFFRPSEWQANFNAPVI